MRGKLSYVFVFFTTAILLILYLVSIRLQTPMPTPVFWIAVTLMLSTVVFQCLQADLSISYARIILLEIALVCVLLHLIYQIPYYGLRGIDSYNDLNSAKGILSTGLVMGSPQYINQTSIFPMIHILGVITSLLTGIDLFSIAKWFPSFLGIALILPLYLLVRHVFKKEKIALLSTLLYACLQIQILFGSLFIRETIALIFAVCCTYLYFSAKSSPHPRNTYALSIVFWIGTVIAHHLTSFMLVIFFLTHFVVTKAAAFPFLRRIFFTSKIKGAKISVVFVIIAISAVFAYWSFVATFPIYSLTSFVKDLLNPGRYGVGTYAEVASISPSSILTFRGYIIFFGFYFFHLIFAVMLLAMLMRRARNHRLEAYSFTLFLFVCGLIGITSLYLVLPAAFPDRFLIFGWLFGFPPLVMTVLRVNYRWLRKIGVFLLVAFMLFNIYMIETPAWDATTREMSIAPSLEDYELANRFDFSNGSILGDQNIILAIYDVHNNKGTYIASTKANLTDFDWIILRKEPISEKLTLLEHSIDYEKICETNNLFVFKRI